MGSSLETALPLAALMMALRQRRPSAGLIHHSLYRSALGNHGLLAMSRKANCYNNAVMESFWSTLKTNSSTGSASPHALKHAPRSSITSSASTTAPAATPPSAIKALSTTNPRLN